MLSRLCIGSARWRSAAVCATVLLFATQVAEAREPPDTIDPARSCVSGECHQEFEKFSHSHWPDFDAPGECDACHEPEGDEHAFTTAEVPSVCLDCHDDLGEKAQAATSVHEAFEDGCLDCHNPHGGKVEKMLVGVEDDDISKLCFECHDADIVASEFKHGPAGLGACNVCHDPHASSSSSLLLAEGAGLCGGCHEEIVQNIESAEYVHDPVDGGCIECHNPHSGPFPKMLPAQKRQLCNECHDDVVEAAESAPVDHRPVVSEDECIGCHDPHASNAPAMLRKPQRELCLSCHDQPVQSDDGTLQNIAAWLAKNDQWHQPVAENQCSGCHQPHGSENFRLLKGSYPTTFYARFEIEKYELCFSCHEAAAMTLQRTRKLTNFRDGDRNLHFLHVNKEKRGRTCRACHEVHASSYPRQLREKVPYGKWMMPLNYEQWESGGSCHPGCHELEAYDRATPSRSEAQSR